MTAQVNNNQSAVQGNPPANNPHVGVGMQISAGIGLAFSMIYEIMTMFSKIIGYDQEQRVNMVQAQAKAAVSQADATKSSGITQAIMYGVMGGLTAVGAAIGFGMSTKATNSAESQAAKNDMEAADKKLTDFKAPEAALKAANKAPGTIEGGNHDPDLDDPNVTERMNELRQQDFKNMEIEDNDNGNTIKALKKMKQNHSDEFEAKKTQFNKDVDGVRMDYNTAATRSNTIQQGVTYKKQLVDTVFQVGTSAAQAAGNGVKAGYDATIALSQTNTQLAGSASGDAGQAQSKATDAQSAGIQVLDRLVDSAKS